MDSDGRSAPERLGGNGRASALAATRPSRRVAFLPAAALDDEPSRCALLAHVAALANAGGGTVVVGVGRHGEPTGWDASELLRGGSDALVSAFAPYLGERFEGFEVQPARKDGSVLATVCVDARTGAPLVFEKESAAFARGTVYFRHGARSEPATGNDLRRFTDRETDRVRRALQRDIRKLANAPKGAYVVVMPAGRAPARDLTNVRVVDDPDAPAVARADFDATHPYRQTEVVRVFNERVGADVVGPYDLQCVRRVHHVTDNPEFFHVPKFGSPQYSEAFVRWLLDEFADDPAFFEKAKDAVRAQRATPGG